MEESMKTLVVGADRSDMRVILLDQEKVVADVYQNVSAIQRNERNIIESELKSTGLEWSVIDQFAVLRVPHSHTSVRVVTTILRTSSWYNGSPIQIVDCEDIKQFDLFSGSMSSENHLRL
jgi:tRNA A37 threonylcarbamoyladenosine modification protein TsaB